MNCMYLIILLCLCGGNCNGFSPFLGCGCNAPSGGGMAQRNGQRNAQKNDQRNNQRGRGCDDERMPRYGSFDCGDDMMQTRDFSGFANNGTCGCEAKPEKECECADS